MAPPPHPALPQPSSVPPVSDWQPIFDDASQLYYWWNVKTNETSWEDPKYKQPTNDEVKKPEGESKSESTPEDAEEDEAREAADSGIEAGAKVGGSPTPEPPSSTDQGTQGETLARDAQPAEDNQPPTGSADSNYYNSEEYYNWYYSQGYGGQAPPNGSATIGATSGAGLPADQGAGPYPVEAAYGSRAPIVGSVDQSDYTVMGAFSTRTGRFQNVDRDERFAAPEQYFDQHSKAVRQMSFFFDYDKYQDERAAQRQAEMAEGPRKPPKLTKKDVEFYKQKKKIKKLSSLRQRFGAD
ncbi:hypothetical protein DFJ77DRAFT_220695 [Powellomyces hirtus]|nr:hypothetical protein DFJ77DRAFT_220695 [Powellomyces hirtus]